MLQQLVYNVVLCILKITGTYWWSFGISVPLMIAKKGLFKLMRMELNVTLSKICLSCWSPTSADLDGRDHTLFAGTPKISILPLPVQCKSGVTVTWYRIWRCGNRSKAKSLPKLRLLPTTFSFSNVDEAAPPLIGQVVVTRQLH